MPEIDPKYPNIRVRLTGLDGNAFAILGRVQSALRQAKLPQQEQEPFWREATAGDYDQLLRACMKWVTVL
jgi:hypothetical protein